MAERRPARRSSHTTVHAIAWNTEGIQLDVVPVDRSIPARLGAVVFDNLYEYDGPVEVAAHPDEPRIGIFIDGTLVGWAEDGVEKHLVPLRELHDRGIRYYVEGRVHWLYPPPGLEHLSMDRQGGGVIAIPAPSELVPLNTAPNGRAIMLPRSAPIQVIGESDYMSNITPWVHDDGSALAHATLHPVSMRRPRSTRRLVEVRIADLPVGHLSDRMSDQMISLVDEFAQAGITVGCLARVCGSSLAAEVAVYPARPSDLSNAWIREQLAAIEG